MQSDRHVFISYSRQDGEAARWSARLFEFLTGDGLECFRDDQRLRTGSHLLPGLRDALERAWAMVAVISPSAYESDWVNEEVAAALKANIPILPVLVSGDLRFPFLGRLSASLPELGEQALLDKIARDLHDTRAGAISTQAPAALTRDTEERYLKWLSMRGFLEHTRNVYIPLRARQQTRPGPAAPTQDAWMRQMFRYQPRPERTTSDATLQSRDFDDAREAIEESRRIVVLGEPGGGKTFTLWQLAADLAQQAFEDPSKLLPLIVPLKQWIDETHFVDFLQTATLPDGDAIAGPLRPHFESVLGADRLLLLLDGLNELPTDQRVGKVATFRRMLEEAPDRPLIASCREKDFESDELKLPMDTLTIQPLSPPQVRAYLRRYFVLVERDEAAADGLFWQLCGDPAVQELWNRWSRVGLEFEQFWQNADASQVLSEAGIDAENLQSAWVDGCRRRCQRDPRRLLHLAANPYLLGIIALVAIDDGVDELGSNRAQLFEHFVANLLGREKDNFRERENRAHPGAQDVLPHLAEFAWNLQMSVTGADRVQLALPVAKATEVFSGATLTLARDANLLEVADTVRFSHQLLQEYFTALGLLARIRKGDLLARDLWPTAKWWDRTGWEEAAVFATGMVPQTPQVMIDWLCDAQPAVLAQCLQESGCVAPTDAQSKALRERWRPRLDPENEPAPEGRHAVATALGELGLDNRPGVGLDEAGHPEIDWLPVEGGPFLLGDDKQEHEVGAFEIARYPVTNAQFQAFIDAGGYDDARWWTGLARRIEAPRDSSWPQPNRPRTDVSWYEAMAYCCWLSEVLGRDVRLPTEEEWEKAARGTEGRKYPWGPEYRSGYANVNETEQNGGPHYLEQTTAVGLYPQGASPCGARDMAGNLWEWCRNEYQDSTRIGESGDAARVVRGGSWIYGPAYARCASRGRLLPVSRVSDCGFRVVCSPPLTAED